VRTGHDPYRVTDNNGWHFCYPPIFAAAVAPLADPPAGEDRTGTLPYAVSVGLWYAISLLAGLWALHAFAKVILPDEPRGSPRWWNARTGPFVVGIGAVGYTLARGQVNLLVVAAIAAAIVGIAHRTPGRIGVALAIAASIKVIPIYLAIVPFARRQTRTLAAGLLTLVLTIAIVPMLLWGPQRAIELHTTMLQAVLTPGVTGGGDQTRADELTNTTATDSQSLQSAIHAWRHPDPATRPPQAETSTRFIHFIFGAIVSLGLLIVIRQTPGTVANDATLLGIATVAMLHLSPVSHMHYYAYGLPLVAVLWCRGLAEEPSRILPTARVLGPLLFWGVATAVPLFPGPMCEWLRERGLGLVASGVLVASALQTLRRTVTTVPIPRGVPVPVAPVRRAA
ncbi:MAG: glycosyltransferase family 87 protein, partial [Gemmataceae bacterium]